MAAGLPFVLLLPGYAILAALYPSKSGIGPVGRLTLSIGLSIAVVPMVAAVLNYTTWGIDLTPVAVSLSAVIGMGVAVAGYRRRRLSRDKVFSVLPGRMGRPARAIDILQGLAVGVALLGVGAAMIVVAFTRGDSGATEFYVLGPSGVAGDYPSAATVGEKSVVTLGIVNRDGEGRTYRIAVIIDGEGTRDIDGLVLGDGERWEEPVDLTPTHAGADQKVEFQLYRDDESAPHRTLNLWLDVADQGSHGGG